MNIDEPGHGAPGGCVWGFGIAAIIWFIIAAAVWIWHKVAFYG